MKKYKIPYMILLAGALLSGCSEDALKGLDQSIVTSEDINDLEKNDPEALIKIADPLLRGIYSYMSSTTLGGLHSDFGWLSIGHMGDVMTDDVALHSLGNGMYTFDYALDYWKDEYIRTAHIWQFFFTIISKSNDLLGKINPDTANPELKAIVGQCYAARGFAYFYLAQLYQQTYIGNEDKPGVPIYLTSREADSFLGRAPMRTLYARIDTDFENAIRLLEGWKRTSKTEIDESVASALYARVCLVKNDWEKSVEYATKALRLTNATLMEGSDLKEEGFNSIDNREWMWGADITKETSSLYASFFSFVCSYDAGYGGDLGCYRKIDKKLYEEMSTSDFRRAQFIDPAKSYSGKESTFPPYTNIKFKKVPNWEADYVYMRVAELYLIQAEGYAQQGKFGEAASALKPLMSKRDPSWNKNAITPDEVYTQRKLELWCEGFSLFDHLRLKKGVERKYNGSNHYVPQQFNVDAGSWLFLFQLPLSEINNNNEISPADQNPTPSVSDKKY